MEDVDQWVRLESEPIQAQEGPPLVPLGEAPMEVEDGAMLAQEDGAVVEEENNTAAEQAA